MARKNAIFGFGALINFILIIISGIIILNVLGIWGDAVEEISDPLTCRGSVGIRSNFQTSAHNLGGAASFPLLCATEQVKIPRSGPNELTLYEDGMHDIAELMAQCWWMFGEGLVDNPLAQSAFNQRQCFQCYSFTLNKEYASTGIYTNDLRKFLREQAYEPYYVGDGCYDGGGQCAETRDECISDGWKAKSTTQCEGKGNYCCYKDTMCENRGGKCRGYGTTLKGHKIVDRWSCKGEEVCWVPNEKVDTYERYIQFSNGKGGIIMDSELEMKPQETYGVAFIGSFKNCNEGDGCDWMSTVGSWRGAVSGFFQGGTSGAKEEMQKYLSTNSRTQYIAVGTQAELSKFCPTMHNN